MDSSGKDELREKIMDMLALEEDLQSQIVFKNWEDVDSDWTFIVDELVEFIAASNQQAVEKALQQQADSITDVIAEFGDQVPLVFQIIDEKLNGYGGDYER